VTPGSSKPGTAEAEEREQLSVPSRPEARTAYGNDAAPTRPSTHLVRPIAQQHQHVSLASPSNRRTRRRTGDRDQAGVVWGAGSNGTESSIQTANLRGATAAIAPKPTFFSGFSARVPACYSRQRELP
jgi:hypothetical protein